MARKWRAYYKLMRFDKPVGMLLLVFPTGIALWLASGGYVDSKVFIVFFLGVIIMRAAGCIANDIADRNFDLHVERTQTRPLATGELTVRYAMYLLIGLLLLAFGLVSLLNKKTVLLSLGAVALALIYPFMKRITYYPQVVLGAAFSFSIPMAYTAFEQPLTLDVLWYYATFLVWTVIYDTQYAMVDRLDDINIGLKSTAILFSHRDKTVIGLLQASMLLSLYFLGVKNHFNVLYYVSILGTAILFIYQQWLIKNRERDKCFRAFLNNQYVGAVLFIGFIMQKP